MLAFTLPTVVLSPLSGRIAGRLGGRPPTLLGVASVIVGLAVAGAGVGGALAVVLVGLGLMGIGAGLAIAPATSVAMSSVPADRAGMASGIMSAQRALGSTAGFAIMGTLLALTISATLPDKLEPFIPDSTERTQVVDQVVDDANPQAVVALIAPGKPLAADVSEEPELLAATDDAFVAGIRVALAAGLVLNLLVLAVGFFVFPRGRGASVEHETIEAGIVERDDLAGEIAESDGL
jgi:MFS family permease